MSISTVQNAIGDNITVEYTGPAAVSLIFVHGFYSDSGFDGWMDTRLLVLPDVENNVTDSARVTKLDTSNAGWTQGGTGNTTTYSFNGSAAELIDGRALVGSDYDDFFPGAVAVNCDPTAETETLIAENPSVDGEPYRIEGYSFSAAQPIYPNHVSIDPFVVLSQEPDGEGGIQGTLRLAESTAATFGSFVPVMLENTATVVLDNPEIANDSFGNLWLELFMGVQGGSPSITLTATEPTQSLIGQDISFQWSGDDGLTAGEFIAFIGLQNADESEQKIVFLSLAYDPDNGGLTVTSPLNPTPETAEPAAPSAPAALAATGANGGVITIAAGMSALLVLAGVGLTLARRRRG